MAHRFKLGRMFVYPNGDAAQVPFMTGSRVNATITSSSSTEAAIPSGARIIEVRSTEAVWLRFGATGVGAAAADANSILFPAGVSIMAVPFSSGDAFSTHFRGLRVGSNDAIVQIESLDIAGT
jgi:hypothetical protein